MGSQRGNGIISNCYATGAVDGGGGGNNDIGGLVGRQLSGGSIVASYATGAVNGGDNASIGGLVALSRGVTPASVMVLAC